MCGMDTWGRELWRRGGERGKVGSPIRSETSCAVPVSLPYRINMRGVGSAMVRTSHRTGGRLLEGVPRYINKGNFYCLISSLRYGSPDNWMASVTGRGLVDLGLGCRPRGLLRRQVGVVGRALKRCHRTSAAGPAVEHSISPLHRGARVLGGIGAVYVIDRAIAAGLDAAGSSCPSSVVGICCFGLVAANPALGAVLQTALGSVVCTPAPAPAPAPHTRTRSFRPTARLR